MVNDSEYTQPLLSTTFIEPVRGLAHKPVRFAPAAVVNVCPVEVTVDEYGGVPPKINPFHDPLQEPKHLGCVVTKGEKSISAITMAT